MMQTVTHGECKDGIYLIIDKGNCRCGITDRLKTAVGLCYLARQNGIGFYFIHRAGFDIRDYLVPYKIPWAAELADISRAEPGRRGSSWTAQERQQLNRAGKAAVEPRRKDESRARQTYDFRLQS